MVLWAYRIQSQGTRCANIQASQPWVLHVSIVASLKDRCFTLSGTSEKTLMLPLDTILSKHSDALRFMWNHVEQTHLPASHLPQGRQHSEIEGDNCTDRVARQTKGKHVMGLCMGCPLLQAVCCKGQWLSRLHADLLVPQAHTLWGSTPGSHERMDPCGHLGPKSE